MLGGPSGIRFAVFLKALGRLTARGRQKPSGHPKAGGRPKARGCPMPRAGGAREILDGPVPEADLRRSLADVARLNALFGGRRATLVPLKRLAAALPPGRRLTVLDVGTGSADIPRAVVRWCRRIGRPVRVFALDRD